MYARNNCLPVGRIDGLRRYAFLGDSMIYGDGVAPDQTLPAVAERQMNAISAYPIEAVNLGIGGNNLWNSWLDFKAMPQIYDGLVITLCSNDMELFGRTYNVPYTVPRSPAWENTHPCGKAVAACFQDIYDFSCARSLPVAVCYYNTFEGASPERIAAILGGLCAAHRIPFIDSLIRVKELKLSRDDLRVGEADEHPSVRVHDAVGRFVVQVLQQEKWFAQQSATDTIADSILSCARAMIESDHYPPEVAQHWALGALEIQLHRVRRAAALAEDESRSPITSRAAVELSERNRCWHTSQRLKTLIHRLLSLDEGRAWARSMSQVEDERVRLEELTYALGTGSWSEFLSGLRAVALRTDDLGPDWPSASSAFFDGCIQHLQRSLEALEVMRPVYTPTCAWADSATLSADLDIVCGLIHRMVAECHRLKAAYASIDKRLQDPSLAAEPDAVDLAARLASHSFQESQRLMELVRSEIENLSQLNDPAYATFTTIQVAIRGKAFAEKPVYVLTAQAEYWVPSRLAARDTANFFSDGDCKFVTLHFPLFYAGRLLLSVKHLQASSQPVEADLIRVEVHNLAGQRQALQPHQFHLDEANRYVSRCVCLS